MYEMRTGRSRHQMRQKWRWWGGERGPRGDGPARRGTRKCTTTLGSGQDTELSELGLVD